MFYFPWLVLLAFKYFQLGQIQTGLPCFFVNLFTGYKIYIKFRSKTTPPNRLVCWEDQYCFFFAIYLLNYYFKYLTIYLKQKSSLTEMLMQIIGEP